MRGKVWAVCHRTGRVVSIQGNQCTKQKRLPICDGSTYHNLLNALYSRKEAEEG